MYSTTPTIQESKITSPLTTQCYDSFRRHLLSRGFTLYPGEFDCLYSKHPLVDIAAKMGSFYWAFEYKSENDSVSRGVDQLQCYLRWFDYVVLVSERAIDHRLSANYWELKAMGAGVWLYDPAKERCAKKSNPAIQCPPRTNRRFVSRRFSRAFQEKRHLYPPALQSDPGRQLDLLSFLS